MITLNISLLCFFNITEMYYAVHNFKTVTLHTISVVLRKYLKLGNTETTENPNMVFPKHDASCLHHGCRHDMPTLSHREEAFIPAVGTPYADNTYTNRYSKVYRPPQK